MFSRRRSAVPRVVGAQSGDCVGTTTEEVIRPPADDPLLLYCGHTQRPYQYDPSIGGDNNGRNKDDNFCRKDEIDHPSNEPTPCPPFAFAVFRRADLLDKPIVPLGNEASHGSANCPLAFSWQA
uniref:Uncharacterized protein n=1 Tax=Trichuris muris TaxID=70415 RepID=A0A5S6Q062_TRIMR